MTKTEEEQGKIQQGLEDYLAKAHVEDPTEWIDVIESSLPAFIHEYIDASYPGIYEQTTRVFYDDVLKKLSLTKSMRDADQQNGQIYSRALKLYSEFLQSKYFPRPDLPMEQKEKKRQKVVEQENDSTQSVSEARPLSEGGKKHVEQEQTYRNKTLRDKCLEYWGIQCQCCGMDFASLYGEELGKGYIEVHHLKPISSIEGMHEVDPVNDLVPLCANCHAMIHRGKVGPLTLGELRTQYRGMVWEITRKKEN